MKLKKNNTHNILKEQGSITVETALILPIFTIALSILITITSLGITQIKLATTSYSAARLIARGETPAENNPLMEPDYQTTITQENSITAVTISTNIKNTIANMLGITILKHTSHVWSEYQNEPEK